MFILETLKEIVQVPPSEFGKTRNAAVTDALNRKYANKVLHNVGLCVRVFDLLSLSEARVDACLDGSYAVRAAFRLIVFRPFIGEVLVGKVASCHPDHGLKISMDFFDDIDVPVVTFPPGTEFDQGQGVFVWRYQTEDQTMDLAIERGAEIAFRVNHEVFRDAEPVADKVNEPTDEPLTEPPYKIIGSISDEGLGPRTWWQ